MSNPEQKSLLECQLLEAQKEKVLAEIAVLRKTTPITESIKILGSMVLGIGGAIAAVAGFQLAEVKAEKYKMEASIAETQKKQAKKDIEEITVSRTKIQQEYSDLLKKTEIAKRNYEEISDKISLAQKQSTNLLLSNTLKTLQQEVNAADIDLRASLPPIAANQSNTSLDTLIEKLFSSKASNRGAAYDELMARFSNNTELVPKLINYSNAHITNLNGVYNSLVVLSHLNHKSLNSDLDSIRTFAKKARANGAKTSERVDKLLQRLPK